MKTQSSVAIFGDYSTDLNRSIKSAILVRKAIKDGKLVRPDKCACGNPNPVAHHRNYNKPLEVEWICNKCHAKIHSNFKFFRGWERFLAYITVNKISSHELLTPLHYKNGLPMKRKYWKLIWDACGDRVMREGGEPKPRQ